ncbi:MAG: tetratricopeptide repeat protein [Gemmataceae bacterium]
MAPTDRVNDLVTVNYQLADIYLRQLPSRADDAVAAGRMEEKLKNAAELLEAFVSAVPEHPSAADALLKLGYCRQRQAVLIANRDEQRKMYSEARTIYERIMNKYPKSEALAPAVLERAKVVAALGDPNGAMNELRRFTTDPLKTSSTAPVALLALATLQRGQNKPAEAATTLEEARKVHEASLSASPTSKNFVATLRYHHAAALREAGKLVEARDLFDGVSREFEQLPEGWDAALRAGQTLKQMGEKRLAEASKQLNNPGLNPEQRAAAEKSLAQAINEIRAAVDYWTNRESDFRKRKLEADEASRDLAQARSRLLYEAAWGWRALAEREIEVARTKLQQERWQKRRDELSKNLAPGQPPPQVALPYVPLREVPLQPAEKAARQTYENILKSFADLNIQVDARLELAELLANRDEHPAAVKLLQEALEGDRDPSPELLEKIKLRLAACLLDQATRALLAAQGVLAHPSSKPDARTQAEAELKKARETIEQALEHAQAISTNEKSKLWQQAVYREAECLLQLGKTDEAIKLLSRFRDDGKFHNLPGLTDRALLRLGAALAQAKQWEASRAAYQVLLERHGSSPWAHEARYGQAWALQNLGRLDEAVNLYTQVTSAVTTDLAARAQLNIGLCRLAQKRPTDAATALLVVPFTYDYPEWSALALLEAARALHEAKQTPQAIGLLKRLLRDYPTTPAADAARQRLTEWGEA